MKIKNMKLMLLGLLAMGSMNAFAWTEGDDANQVFSVNGITYKVTTGYKLASGINPAQNGKVTIIEYSATTTTDAVVIPETVQNQTQSLIAKVPTENVYDVISIANYASGTAEVFKGAKATSITLPANLQTIGANAFEGAEAATIVIPAYSKLTTIGNSAFKDCANLATFATENAKYIQSIGTKAFEGCAKLTAITLTDELKTIGDGAFKGTGIVTLDLSACKNFTTANSAAVNRWFTDDTGAPNNQYNTNSKLTTVKLPTALAATTDVLAIAANAFKGCTALTQIGATAGAYTIPAYINSIGDGAFVNSGVTKLDLSASVLTTIKATATPWFTKKTTTTTPTLTQIVLNKDVTYTTFGTDLQDITTLKKVGSADGDYVIPKKAKAILTAAVFQGTGLEKLDISKIDDDDYKVLALFGTGISTLTEVKLNAKTTKLDAEAFANCTALATLNNIDKLKEVGDGAFYRTAITSLTFGAPLTAAGFAKPFTPTTYLKDDAGKDLPYYTAASLSIDLSACTNLTTITGSAFKGLSMLTSVKLPTNLVAIGSNAFEGTGITAIEIPAGVDGSTGKVIGNAAFKDCKSLKTVTYLTTGTTEICAVITGDNNVYKGCNLVTINASSEYVEGKTAPINTIYAPLVARTIETILDQKTKGYAMRGFYAEQDYKIKASEVTTIYEAYIDEGNVVLSRLKKIDGFYQIPLGMSVLVRTVAATTVEPIKNTGTAYTNGSSLLGKTGTDFNSVLKAAPADGTAKPEANYVYALTNRAGEGFAFSFYSGSEFKKDNIWVVNSKAPSAAGRMNIIFLDEDGNVEFETTAIQGVQNEAENDGEIFNLSGQKVNANYKGVVIKNGKKMIQK